MNPHLERIFTPSEGTIGTQVNEIIKKDQYVIYDSPKSKLWFTQGFFEGLSLPVLITKGAGDMNSRDLWQKWQTACSNFFEYKMKNSNGKKRQYVLAVHDPSEFNTISKTPVVGGYTNYVKQASQKLGIVGSVNLAVIPEGLANSPLGKIFVLGVQTNNRRDKDKVFLYSSVQTVDIPLELKSLLKKSFDVSEP